MLYNIPLYGYTTIYLSIHLLEDILIASIFHNYEWSCHEHLCVGFCVGVSSQSL